MTRIYRSNLQHCIYLDTLGAIDFGLVWYRSTGALERNLPNHNNPLRQHTTSSVTVPTVTAYGIKEGDDQEL